MTGQDFKRRDLIKASCGGAGLFSLLPEISSAKTRTVSDLAKGRRSIVDVKIVHPDANEEIPRIATGGGLRRTYVTDSQLYIINASINEVLHEDSNLIRSPNRFSPFGRTGMFRQRYLFSRTTFDGASAELLGPKKKYQKFQFNMKFSTSGDLEVSQGNSHTATVTEGDEVQVGLPMQRVTVPEFGEEEKIRVERPTHSQKTVRPVVGSKEVDVSPELVIRNNGESTIYGLENAAVVPQVNDPIIQQILHGAIGFDEFEIDSVEGEDMWVIRNTSENGGSE